MYFENYCSLTDLLNVLNSFVKRVMCITPLMYPQYYKCSHHVLTDKHFFNTVSYYHAMQYMYPKLYNRKVLHKHSSALTSIWNTFICKYMWDSFWNVLQVFGIVFKVCAHPRYHVILTRDGRHWLDIIYIRWRPTSATTSWTGQHIQLALCLSWNTTRSVQASNHTDKTIHTCNCTGIYRPHCSMEQTWRQLRDLMTSMYVCSFRIPPNIPSFL